MKKRRPIKREIKNNFKSPASMVSYVFKNYFRVIPKESLDSYVSEIREKPYFERLEIVQTTKYPDVLISLSKDTDPSVRDAVFRTQFWKIIGRNLEIIDFSSKEKISLLRDENLQVLLTFLLYEEDVKIIVEVLNHPLLSLQMILEYERFLRARGFGLNDQKILNAISEIIQQKKERFHTISSIIEAKNKSNIEEYKLLFNKILSPDKTIQKSVLNALETNPVSKLIVIINQPQKLVDFMDGYVDKAFDVMLILYNKFIPSEEIINPEIAENEIFKQSSKLELIWKNYLEKQITKFLNFCGKDITHFSNLLTIVKAHICPINKIIESANNILSVNDIFSLIMEEHFPIASSKIIANVLEEHPDKSVQKKIEEFYLRESERLRKKLKEIELSINAYFDIVFDTLGYPQISEIRQNLKMLNQSFRLFEGFFANLNTDYMESRKGFLKIYYLIIRDFQKKLDSIYCDISDRRIEEIQELFEILQLVYDVKDSFLESEIDTANEKYNANRNKRLIKQAEIIWSSSISLYLGRLKELDNILRKKWLNYLDHQGDIQNRNLLVAEMKNVIQVMESEYKLSVQCTLPLSCKVCQKRSCASVRFINQVEFFASEFIDYIKGSPLD